MNELQRMILITLGDQEYTDFEELTAIFDGQTEGAVRIALDKMIELEYAKEVEIEDSIYYTRTMAGYVALDPERFNNPNDQDIPF